MKLARVNAVLLIGAALLGALPRPAAAQTRSGAAFTLSVEPELFSPNGDGRLEDTTISVRSDVPATARVEVVDGADRVVRSWTFSVAPGAPGSVVWDGATDTGPATDGRYRVVARSEAAVDLMDRAEAPVAIDTAAPRLDWAGSPPRLTTGSAARFRFRVADASSPLHARLDIALGTRTLGEVERRVDAGRSRLIWRAAGAAPLPGTYLARLEVRDAAGNQGPRLETPWRVERPTRARVWRSVPGAGRRVALTIDDCHVDGAWSSMLTTLRRRDAGATFFCPGLEMRSNPALVRRTVREGHAIGSHGWDHADLTALSPAEIQLRLRRDAETLWDIARRTTAPYMRPPYAFLDRSVVEAAGRTGHARVVLWDVDPQDWLRPGAATIVSRVLGEVRPGSIVVLHTLPETAAALPAILSGLRDRDLEPVTLDELFGHARRRG